MLRICNYAQVRKFDSNGTFLLQWGSKGTGYGQFFHPSAVALDSDGNVYVADSGNDRIVKFSPKSDTGTRLPSSAPEPSGISPWIPAMSILIILLLVLVGRK